jgi:DNA polymerase-3 subunit delta
LADPPRDCVVLLEAGDLKRGAALREAVERDRAAVAIACYRDSDQDLARLVEAEVTAAGLSLAPDARAFLLSQLGGDRLASRGELAKLVLYAGGQERVTLEDVRAVVGDVADFQLNDLIDAAAEGRVQAVEQGMRRAAGAGVAGPAVATVALRHFETLHRARAALDAGEPVDAVLASLRPPPFPQRRERLARQARQWRLPALEAVLDGLGRASLETRRKPALAFEIAERALLDAAMLARGRVQASG